MGLFVQLQSLELLLTFSQSFLFPLCQLPLHPHPFFWRERQLALRWRRWRRVLVALFVVAPRLWRLVVPPLLLPTSTPLQAPGGGREFVVGGLGCLIIAICSSASFSVRVGRLELPHELGLRDVVLLLVREEYQGLLDLLQHLLPKLLRHARRELPVRHDVENFLGLRLALRDGRQGLVQPGRPLTGGELEGVLQIARHRRLLCLGPLSPYLRLSSARDLGPQSWLPHRLAIFVQSHIIRHHLRMFFRLR
mmetsp:Transcript_13131/g.35965  ORF Transcript_13131/g.35965 Transcript_13131/m.35965 type:complete len:250 (-) Transcript_13131:183-932(-)